MHSYMGRAQRTMRDGRRAAQDRKLLLQFSSSQNSISHNSLSNMTKAPILPPRQAAGCSLTPTGSLVFFFGGIAPAHSAAGANNRAAPRVAENCVLVWRVQLQLQSPGSCPVFWDRLETFPGATQNLSECLTLLHIQEKQSSRVSLSLPQGKDCAENKPAHVSQGVWSFCCWLQLKTLTETANPFKSFVNLSRGKWSHFSLLIHPISFLNPTLRFHVFAAFWRQRFSSSCRCPCKIHHSYPMPAALQENFTGQNATAESPLKYNSKQPHTKQ